MRTCDHVVVGCTICLLDINYGEEGLHIWVCQRPTSICYSVQHVDDRTPGSPHIQYMVITKTQLVVN